MKKLIGALMFQKKPCRRLPIRGLTLFALYIFLAAILLAGCNKTLSPIQTNDLKSISVVMDNNYPPFTFLDANGNLQGILIDRWQLWEKKTGIAVEITGLDWSKALQRMQAGEFDVIDTIFLNESRAKFYDFSKPYETINVPIYFQNDISGIIDAKSLKGFPVAVKANDAVIEFLKSNGITDLDEFDSYESIIKAAVNHEVIVFAMDKPPAEYFLHKYGLQGQFNSTEPLYSGQFHRAVLKGDSELLGIVENGFSQITAAENKAIDRKWYGTPVINKKYVTYAGLVVAGVLVIVLVLISWNHYLRATVKRKTKTLQESEQKFRQIFETAGIGISINDENGQFISGNPAILRILGYTPDEYKLLSIRTISHPDDVIKNNDLYRDFFSGKRDSFTLEKRSLHKDGHFVWGRVTNSIVRDAYGNSLFFIGMFEDISERKNSEKVRDSIYKLTQVAISSATLDELYVSIHTILCELMSVENFYIALYDPTDNLLHFPFFKDQFEESADPIEPGHGLTDYVLRMGRPLLATQDVFEQLLGDGEVDLIGTKPVDWLGVPLIVNEQVIGVMAAQSYSPDIHYTQKDVELLAFVSTQVAQAIELKRAEESLRKSEADMRALFAAMTDIIMVLDSKGKYLKIVGTNTNLLYRPSVDLVGKTLHELFDKDIADAFLSHINTALSSSEKVIFEYALPIENKVLWFSASISPITDGTVIWVAHDITKRKQAEEAQRISEARYRELFEESPTALWEEDFSEVKKYLDHLKHQGISDFTEYFESHPEDIIKCASLIKVVDVNRRAIKMVHAKDKNELIENIEQILSLETNATLSQELIQIAEGKTTFKWEGINQTLDGISKIVSVRWQAATGYEDSLSKVILSMTNITKSKQAEEALLASEEKYRTLVDNIGEGIGIVDEKEFFVFANPSAHDIFGEKPGTLIGRNLNDFLSPAVLATVQFQTIMRKTGEFSIYEIEIIRPNGERRNIQVSARPQVDGKGSFLGTFGIFRDITEQKKAENRLQYRSQFEVLLTQISTRFINLTSHEIGSEINEALKLVGQFENVDRSYLFRIDPKTKTISNTHEWCGKGIEPQIGSIQNLPVTDVPWILNQIASHPVIINRVADLPDEAILEKKIFESQSIQSLVIFPMQVNDQLIGFVGFDSVQIEREWEQDSTVLMEQFANILGNAIERSRLSEILEDRAIHDELTGILNRRGFTELAKMELVRAHRYGRPFSLILFDLDHLKRVNDTFGHAAGDLAIKAVVNCCLKSIRETDTLGRWGGDEFVLLLPESDQKAAIRVAERLQESISNCSFILNGEPVKLTASIGVAVEDKTKLSMDELFRNADSALYSAKQAGRNCIHVYTETE
jgi:diguanylate cyclase (GGDEF)-like protein/PAS domain S-box-containing protein